VAADAGHGGPQHDEGAAVFILAHSANLLETQNHGFPSWYATLCVVFAQNRKYFSQLPRNPCKMGRLQV
jgi:hypothetical protein